MEETRREFWQHLLSETMLDMRQLFKQGPKPFREASPDILGRIGQELSLRLEAMLTPTIVAFVQAHRAKGNAYRSLFDGQHEATVDRLQEFHSPTIAAILQRVRTFKLHVATLCCRIFSDWEAICSSFDLSDEDCLTSCSLMAGDPHHQGEQTAIFRFAMGQKGFVYKPIDITVDELLRSLLTQLRTNFADAAAQPRVLLASGQYGYVEYLPYQGDTSDADEASSLFQQFGELLALGKAFAISDGHFDNLLVHRHQLIWLDLETAFNFTIAPDVHPLERTGLLFVAKPENTVLGISTGLQGGILSRLSLTYPIVHGDGTDEMYIRYFGLRDVRNHNRIFLNGMPCYPEDFVEEIKVGYSKMHDAIRQNLHRIENALAATMGQREIRARYIPQATACYARFCALLHHYASHRKGDALAHICRERQRTFSAEERPFANFMLESELLDLTSGVIPYFYRSSASRALYHISGAYRSGYFGRSLLEDILQNLHQVCQTPIQDDLSYIDDAVASTKGIRTWDQFRDRFSFPVFDFQERLQTVTHRE